jgi:hypothetical protein
LGHTRKRLSHMVCGQIGNLPHLAQEALVGAQEVAVSHSGDEIAHRTM